MKRRFPLWRVFLAVSGIAIIAAGIFAAVALVHALTPKDISKRQPSEVFRWLVCNPVPPSVSDIRATGKLMFAGDGVVVEFSIQPKDVMTLLKEGGFREDEGVVPPMPTLSGETDTGSGWQAYTKTNAGFGGSRTVRLWIGTNTSRAYVHYSRI